MMSDRIVPVSVGPRASAVTAPGAVDAVDAGTPTDAERSAVAAVVSDAAARGQTVVDRIGAPYGNVAMGGWASRRRDRTLLLPCLHALVDVSGFVSQAGLRHVADVLGVPIAEAWGVATFYDLLPTTKPGSPILTRVCDDIVCGVVCAGAGPALESSSAEFVGSPCLGQCDSGWAQLHKSVGEPYREVRNGSTMATSAVSEPGFVPVLLPSDAEGGDTSLAAYLERGGGRAFARAIALGPDGVIDLIGESGLRGRGGAAFPAAIKWRAVADAPGRQKHVVANADESEPGTFKDRVLIESNPYALIEAMCIAGLAVGANKGWIYIRGEYPTALGRLHHALRECRAAGLLGGQGRWARPQASGGFEIEVRVGAGAYICGEETALLNSIEGFRGEPRVKPPLPTTHGLFGQPTLVNNVETFANVVPIVADGADTWRLNGTADSPGTRLFCLSGHIAQPGVYEWPMGVTLRRVIDSAGGIAGTGRLQAVLIGGAAGSMIGPQDMDLELSFEGAAAAGVSLGSGVIIPMDDSVDMIQVARRLTRFFAHESCGQCVPCRLGTVRMDEQIRSAAPDRDVVRDLDRVMTDASICGLGQTAASALRSMMELGLIGGRP